MQVYVSRGGQQHGPYPIDQLVAMFGQGTISGTDLAWHDGAAGWISVAELLHGSHAVSIPLPKVNSALGVSGFIIALVAVPVWLLILIVAGAAHTRHSGGQNPTLVFVGLGLFAMLGLNALGAVLGFVAVSKKAQRTTLTIVGLAMNLIEIFGIIGMTLLGLSMR
jgi:hypothetical protein